MASYDVSSPERIAAHAASAQYINLHPKTDSAELHRELKDLLPIVSRIESPGFQLTTGSIAIEASLGAHSNIERKNLLRKANKTLDTWLNNESGRTTLATVQGARLRNLSEALITRKLPGEAYAASLSSNLAHLVRGIRYDRVYNQGERMGILGMIMEQSVMCLTTDEENGLLAVPSFTRQELATTHVDGKNYRWDITIESDGSTVPAGQYRAQVKRAPPAKVIDEYHPDILMIVGTEHLGEDRYDFTSLPAANAILDVNTPQVNAYKDTLFDLMSRSGPASENLSFIG